MAWSDPTKTAEKWDAFASALVQGIDPTRAAIDAGYGLATAAATGRRLAASTEIQALVNLKRAQIASAVADDWDPRRVINELASLATQSRQDGQYNVARQCYRDIGEHIGMWPKQAVQVDARQQVLALPDSISTDDLRALASGMMAAADDDAIPYIEQSAQTTT